MSTRLERIIHIDHIIRAGGCPTPAGLAAHFEVSPRTIYDDRTFMIDRLGAPMSGRGRRGWGYDALGQRGLDGRRDRGGGGQGGQDGRCARPAGGPAWGAGSAGCEPESLAAAGSACYTGCAQVAKEVVRNGSPDGERRPHRRSAMTAPT
jgi:hypothetical protein